MADTATIRPEHGREPGHPLTGVPGSPALPDDPWRAEWQPRTPGPTQLDEIKRWEREHKTTLETWSTGFDIDFDLADVEDPTEKPSRRQIRRARKTARRSRKAGRRAQTVVMAVPDPEPEPNVEAQQEPEPERHLTIAPPAPGLGRRLGRMTRLSVYVVVLTMAAAAWYFALGTLVVSRGTALASGWEVTTIATGSMRPALDPGDLVAYAPIDPADLKRNLIIVFDNPAIDGGMIVHRLIGFNSDGTLITKGDANEKADSTPISVDAVRGQVKMVSPYGGFPNMLLHQGKTEHFVALVGALFLAALIVHAPSPGKERGRRR